MNTDFREHLLWGFFANYRGKNQNIYENFNISSFISIEPCKHFCKILARILEEEVQEFWKTFCTNSSWMWSCLPVRFVQEFSAGIPAEFLIKILQFRINSCKIIVRILHEFCLKNVRILPEYKNLYWLKNTKFYFF